MRHPLHTPPGARGTRLLTVAGLTSLILVASLLTACSSDDDPDSTIDAFLAGWRSGDLTEIGFLTAAGARIPAAEVATDLAELAGELADSPPELRRDARSEVTGDIARGNITVDWPLPGGATWTYPTSVRLKRASDGSWQVIWEPAVIHEKLTDGDQLTVRRLTPPRAAILDRAGQPIVAPQPVVVVGVQPNEVTDPPALVKQLDAAFKAIRPAITPPIDLSGLPDRLAATDPGAFVDVVTLREDAYRQIKPQIYDLPGTKFRAEQRDLAPTREFARALLGTVDPVQKQDMEAHPDRYAVGDMVGHGGLQGRYDERLRGTPGAAVIVARKGPDGAVTATDTELFRTDPEPGSPVRTALDVPIQKAADAALTEESRRSALVAVRISDGALVAVANGPDGGGENLALTAQVPPGSTFKMISTLGLLEAGSVTLDGPVACPRTATVEGRSFKNSNDFELGTVPFRVDFATSCNTAFVALAPKLGDSGLAEAGRKLGLEGNWSIGLDAFSGKVSTGGSAAERAAAVFGQGATVVSPVAMAAATAAVAHGQWRQPSLVVEPAPESPAPDGPALDASSVEPLRTMMREVVTTGTAEALADVPGGSVHGKTGTAEYDNNPANTHAWFVGWQNDIAFAVFVEQGGSGSGRAVPIAERFLRNLTAG